MGIDPTLFGGEECFVDAVFEFADVAGPCVGQEFFLSLGCKVDHVDGFFAGEIFEEMAGKGDDIGGAFAQRRDLDGDHGEAVVEVFTEGPFFDKALEIAVSRGDQTKVDRIGFFGSEGLDFAFFEQAQELGLRSQREVADLVHE